MDFPYYGLVITDAVFDEDHNKIELHFPCGRIELWDDAQSCCEQRYIRTDDDIKKLVGKRLTKIDIKSVDVDELDDWKVHETQFLEISAEGSCVTFCAHNEHNGYYGGFDLNFKFYGANVTNGMNDAHTER